MEIGIQIITSDHELGFDLVNSCRFPERRPVICPGEVMISSQNMRAASDDPYANDIIEFTITVNEDSSVAEFAGYLYSVLITRPEKISSLAISGAETQIDEVKIKQAIEAGMEKL